MTVCEQCRPMYEKYKVNPWQYLPEPKIYSGDGYGMTPEGVRDAIKADSRWRVEWRRKALADIRRWCAEGRHQKAPKRPAAARTTAQHANT